MLNPLRKKVKQIRGVRTLKYLLCIWINKIVAGSLNPNTSKFINEKETEYRKEF